MARFVVTTLGSLGDLHPMVPVAEELLRRGHLVRVAVPAALKAEVDRQGFDAYLLPALKLPGSVQAALDDGRNRAAIRELAGPHLELVIGHLESACEGADAILTTPHQLASAIVGERRRIPWVTLTVFPGYIPSAFTVPQPHWLPALPTPVGRAVNRVTWRAYRYALWHISGDYINRAVESRGLVLDRRLFAPGGVSPHLTLVLSSPSYSPRLPDWPASVKVTGFTQWDQPRDWQEPPELARFLENGPAPVVVTTSTARNGALFFTIAQQALALTGRRGIFLTGRASKELLGGAPHLVLETGIAAWPYIPLSHLLPRAPLVIHHAGIGTVLTTIRHGLPAVGVPSSFDQWYNAGRMKALGVGRIVPGSTRQVSGETAYRHLTARRLADEIDRVASDPAYRERARALMAQMQHDGDGASRACDEIEALLRSRVRT